MSAENLRKVGRFGWKSMGLMGALALALSALLSAGCSIVAQEQSSTASNTTVLLPWVSEGGYHFERVELKTLINISNLQGTAALFLLSPSVVDAKLVGFQPRVRTFVDAEGSHVPTDSSSIQLLTLYAHLEKLEEMDRGLGLETLLPKPRVVGVEVRIPNQQNMRGQVQNNALYSPSLDALLFVPFEGEPLPLAVNAGVIAHEHFHALFNFLVLKSVKEKIKSSAAHVHPEDEAEMEKNFGNLDGKITVQDMNPKAEWESYHENLLRGMNEGLADVWGWIYTGDPVFVRRSLPTLEKTRDLDVDGLKVQSMDVFRAYTRSAVLVGTQSGRAYALGTEYARVIKSVFEEDFKKRGVDRIELAKIILRVLPKLEARMKNLGDTDWVRPAELLEMFAADRGADHLEVCSKLLSFTDDLKEADISAKCGAAADAAVAAVAPALAAPAAPAAVSAENTKNAETAEVAP